MTDTVQDSEVFERVRDVLCEVLNVKPSQIVPDAKFREDLAAESLDLISVISELEDAFDTEISDEDAQELKTVGDAVEFVRALAKQGAVAS